MAKSAPAKKIRATSTRSRAARREASPSIDTDKSLKEIKAPEVEKRPSVLAIHQGAGISKKSKQGRKGQMSARAKRRQESAMDRAEAVLDKKIVKIDKSKDRARTIQSRSAEWEEMNKRLKAARELKAAMAAGIEGMDDEDEEAKEKANPFEGVPVEGIEPTAFGEDVEVKTYVPQPSETAEASDEEL